MRTYVRYSHQSTLQGHHPCPQTQDGSSQWMTECKPLKALFKLLGARSPADLATCRASGVKSPWICLLLFEFALDVLFRITRWLDD
jgi:hypothetical protein